MLRIILVGKPREKYVLEGINEYAKRIGKYNLLELINVKKEDDIEKNIKGILFVLDEHGKQLDS